MPRAVGAAIDAYADRIERDVHHGGIHDESTFGGASHLTARRIGNILVDVPRFALPLVRRIEELGGVRWLSSRTVTTAARTRSSIGTCSAVITSAGKQESAHYMRFATRAGSAGPHGSDRCRGRWTLASSGCSQHTVDAPDCHPSACERSYRGCISAMHR